MFRWCIGFTALQHVRVDAHRADQHPLWKVVSQLLSDFVEQFAGDDRRKAPRAT